MKISIIPIVLILAFLFSCKKDNTSGDGTVIKGSISLGIHAVHHTWDIPEMNIYLKRNCDTFPGTDPLLYEYAGLTNYQGKITFEKLLPGKYFIYGIGYDSIWGSMVYGELPVSLYSEYLISNHADVTLQVSE